MTTAQPSQVSDLLAEVGHLCREAWQVEARTRTVVKAARAAGATPTDLARAADVTRPTIYRWLREDSGMAVDVAEILNDALVWLADRVSDYTAGQILRGISQPDISVKIRRYELGLKNLPPGSAGDAELREVLALASATIDQARTRKRGQHWPTEVTLP